MSQGLQRKLRRQLVRIKADDPRALEVFTELGIELAAHAAAEGRFLHTPILLDDLGLKPSRHALPDLAKRLLHEVHHHLKEEETTFFQLPGKILSDLQKDGLAGKYRQDLKRMQAVEV